VPGFYVVQAGYRTHDVRLSLLSFGWNIVSFRALDAVNSFNIIYIFYPATSLQSPLDLSRKTADFVATVDRTAASECLPSPQPLSTSSAALGPPSQTRIHEQHCTFRCPVADSGDGAGGEGRALLAMTARNSWQHTQVKPMTIAHALLELDVLQVALAALHRNPDPFDLLIISDDSDDVTASVCPTPVARS
jgi:hypothetical protein